MSLKEDAKSILAELSPILAGFKLAVIVIGYFGLGSVAKWIISYWYPFTRWIWDQLAHLLLLPVFPIIVKDSLTALTFFLPLGITAIIQRTSGNRKDTTRHRFWGTFFGLLFLFFICKDVISSVADSIAISLQTINSGNAEKTSNITKLIWFASYFLVGVVSYSLLHTIRRYPIEGAAFFSKLHRLVIKIEDVATRYRRKMYSANILFIAISFIYTTFSLVKRSAADDATAILGAMLILLFIVVSLLLAIVFAPRKLFITTGASVAFVLAAVLFDGFISAKDFMENVSDS